jgi:hypothetical protein
MNRAMVGAIKKGIAAKEAGLSELTCPYRDKRKANGRLSWSRAFRYAWFDGYTGRVTQLDLEALKKNA